MKPEMPSVMTANLIHKYTIQQFVKQLAMIIFINHHHHQNHHSCRFFHIGVDLMQLELYQTQSQNHFEKIFHYNNDTRDTSKWINSRSKLRSPFSFFPVEKER